MGSKKDLVRESKRRRHPPVPNMPLDPVLTHTEPKSVQVHLPQESVARGDTSSAYIHKKEAPSAFSKMLCSLLKGKRERMTHLACELGVTQVTIYRWMKGTSNPRPAHLQHLLVAFPEHRQEMLSAIEQSFPALPWSAMANLEETQKDVYRRVMNLVATVADADLRRWQITQTVFDYALLQLAVAGQGVVMTYAQLMPERADGVHSLYEIMTCGSAPWLPLPQNHAYLGCTTAAGIAAISQHMFIWDEGDENERVPVDVESYIRSSCAYPVMRGGLLAGVLVISSTQLGFSSSPIVRQALVEYAQLLGLALRDDEFKPFSVLKLRLLPNLAWQREEIAKSYINRVIAACQRGLSRREAESMVQAEIELEFEEFALVSDDI
ncbi:MAG: helix-turn-helix transcriptional regulator [Ktedonobacteraceae bacterium]|nr:helix-turn-helix transcriptional regulator [Ktedonobacteraceae bacterium]